MRETSLYCRPDVICAVWFALQTRTSGVLVFAKDKTGKPLGPYQILYLDTDQQLGITNRGLVVLLPLDNALADAKGKATAELTALLATPRHIRKPDNYIHPDDCPDHRRLRSKQDKMNFDAVKKHFRPLSEDEFNRLVAEHCPEHI